MQSDEQERLDGFRLEQVAKLELEAIQAEARAAKWDQIARERKNGKQLQNATHERAQAQKVRDAANKLHGLAGTSPIDFYPGAILGLRADAESLRLELVVMRERAEHPDIYLRDGSDPDTATFDAVANAALREALLAKADELEALLEDAASKEEPKPA